MASYRFCRSDDLALLARADARCFRPHFPDLPALEPADLKRLAREIDLWSSSCMVALEGDEPVAVLLATKRETASLVWRVGVHPAHLRRGHARHLLTSFGAKLAILGPPRIFAEVPEELGPATALFEACGFEREVRYTDFVQRAPEPGGPPPEDLVVPLTLDDLVASGAFDLTARRAWERSPATLLKRREHLRGFAVAPGERIEAWLLFEDAAGPPERRLLAFGCAEASRRETWLGLLVRAVGRAAPGPLAWRRVAPGEVPADLLRSMGFATAGSTAGLAARPRPA